MDTALNAAIGTVINSTPTEPASVNIAGMNIGIADIIGEKLVNQWFTTLSQEQMEAILNGISDNILQVVENYKGEKLLQAKTQIPNPSYPGWGNDKYRDNPLWKYVQHEFEQKFQDMIKSCVKAELEKEETKQRVNRVVDELLDYAINGYKEDMKNRLRQNLVDNVFASVPSYGNPRESLMSLIDKSIDERIRNPY